MACHGPDGKGLAMLGPPLVGSEWTTGSASRLAAILLQGMTGPIEVNGKEYIPAAAMPGLKHSPDIGDQHLADGATFVRHAWGNKRGAISPKLLAAIKDATPAKANKGVPQWAVLQEFDKAPSARDAARRLRTDHPDFEFTSRLNLDDGVGGILYARYAG